MSLRTRLLLLVVAGMLPLLCLGVVREALDYQAERDAVYEGLMTVARGTAIAVERDLELRISNLETLAMAPTLQAGDFDAFTNQADSFLSRQPPGSALGILQPDGTILRSYGAAITPGRVLPLRTEAPAHTQVFGLGKPGIVDLHVGKLSNTLVFSLDVPVFRDGTVVYDIFLRLTPPILADLVARQRTPRDSVLTLVDAAGVVIARIPNGDRFVGSHIKPELWDQMRTRWEGLTIAPTLEGTVAAAVFTHVGATGWAVAVGAPEDAVFAPVRERLLHLITVGLLTAVVGALAAMLAARSITRPIEWLRGVAALQDPAGMPQQVNSGLAEIDLVAHALMRGSADRHNVAKALAESEQRFRTLFERSPSGTILLDPQTRRVIDCNEAAAMFVGLTVLEFRGALLTDFSIDTDEEDAAQILNSVVAGETLRYETRIKGRTGPRHLTLAVAPVQVSGRTLVLITQIDVTDLRDAEAHLRVNEERLELAREGADLGIWDWNIANGTLTWSKHQWYLHGLQPRCGGPTVEEWESVIHPSHLAATRAELREAIRTPTHSYVAEYSVVLSDGTLRRLLGRGKTIRDSSGRAIRMVGINMDVSARYEAEMARDRLIAVLETERGRLASIMEALPIGVGIVGPAGHVILGNMLMRRLSGPVIPSLSGWEADRWVAFNADGSRVAPQDFPGGRALRGETVLPGEEFLFKGQNGTETWIRVGALPLRMEDGVVQEALIMLMDIDAEKRLMAFQQEVNARLEQRVREEMAAREAAQQRAAHAERMHALGQIAGGIAHDFNNVLQAVSGGAALIERRPNDPDRVMRSARMVADAAKRGAAITSRLLAFARRGDLRAESVDAGVLLTDMAEVLTHTLGGSVICRVSVPPRLPRLFADRGQLETVLVNLATNARDAMPAGGTLTLSAEAETVTPGMPHPAGLAPGAYVRIIARDTGMGMDPSVLARVTEPFFTTKGPGKGTGLGLAMAKGFTEQSGGSLSIESAEGQGTAISLWLPQAPVQAALVQPATRPTPSGTMLHPHVLLVDDDAIVRQVLTISLEEAGHAVVAADSGARALALLSAGEKVDIIVSDLTMPTMDGLALIKAAQEKRPGLPAILLTGYAGDGAALAVGGAISGTFSLLRKPVSGSQLIDRITALLSSRREAVARNRPEGVPSGHGGGV